MLSDILERISKKSDILYIGPTDRKVEWKPNHDLSAAGSIKEHLKNKFPILDWSPKALALGVI